MTEHELLRIIAFLERVRLPFQELVPIAEEDATWNMLLYLIRNHLTGTPGRHFHPRLRRQGSPRHGDAAHPRADGARRHRQKNASDTGKRFLLLPSEALLESFIQYARRIKSLLAETFGLRAKTDSDEDFYFGGSYFAAQIIPPPRLIESLFRGKREIKFLLNDDNYFLSMRNMWADFRNNMASRTNFDLRKLPQLHERLIENSKREVSEYDIVAINAPWLGEAVKKNLVIPLDSHIKAAAISPLDFHPSVWSMGTWRGQQFGIPIYCTIELLAARSDLFEKDKFDYPTTFEKTVAAARHFHAPAKERYGIAWNGGRGMPIASTFMFLMGCCGESILRIPKTSLAMGVDEARGEQLRPQIQSDAGLRVLDYLHKLKEVSPPDILEMDWDRRTTSFLSGQTALAYCWTVRAARFETDVSSAVKRKVSYLPQPRGPAGASNNPIGGFLLCIPSNLPPERIELAFEAIAWMTSPEAMKANVQNGFPVAPRFSVSADPEAAATSPIVSVVDRLAKQSLLKAWPRPPVPEYLSLEAILGEEIHRALRREVSDREALKNAQIRGGRGDARGGLLLMTDVDAIVIGAGVVGLAVARALSSLRPVRRRAGIRGEFRNRDIIAQQRSHPRRPLLSNRQPESAALRRWPAPALCLCRGASHSPTPLRQAGGGERRKRDRRHRRVASRGQANGVEGLRSDQRRRGAKARTRASGFGGVAVRGDRHTRQPRLYVRAAGRRRSGGRGFAFRTPFERAVESGGALLVLRGRGRADASLHAHFDKLRRVCMRLRSRARSKASPRPTCRRRSSRKAIISCWAAGRLFRA